RVDGGNLPLAVGVVERVGDALHRDAEAPGLAAVDLHRYARAAFLIFRGDLAQRRLVAQLLHQFVGPLHDLVGIAADQGVLILRPAGAGRNLDVLRRLEIDRHAGNAGDRMVEAGDDLLYARGTVVARLQRDGEVTNIGRGVDRAHPDHRNHAAYVHIGADNG